MPRAAADLSRRDLQAILAATVHGLRLPTFLFTRALRLHYMNPAAEELVVRLRREYDIELPVVLADFLAEHTTIARSSPPATSVSMLTAQNGEPFYLHAFALHTGHGRRARPHVAVTVRHLGSEISAFGARYGLSGRELQIAGLVLRGYANKDIAQHLGISVLTAKKHLQRIFDKVGIDSRAQLIVRMA